VKDQTLNQLKTWGLYVSMFGERTKNFDKLFFSNFSNMTVKNELISDIKLVNDQI